jgi:tripartite-type tricarboxylate transporter receptor subunit TctC
MDILSRRILLAGLASAAALRPERALAAWPERNVTLMHGLAPGGGVDVSARLIAEGLSRRLGQQVVVEPRPGAAATLAAAQIARATPDGYTLGFIPGSHAVTAATYRTLPYHPLDDFTFVGQALDVPFLVVTYAEHSLRTIPDLIKLAKARSEPLLCGVPGQGTSQHLLIEHLSRLAGVKIQPVAFRGGNLALNELLGKRLDFLIDPPTALLPQIKSGTLRAIGVTGGTRFAELPDIGTIAEAGFPGFSVTSWMGVAGPAKLPPEITARLNSEITALVAEPAMAQRIRALGSEPASGPPEKFKALIAADIARWTKVVADAGIERVGG